MEKQLRNLTLDQPIDLWYPRMHFEHKLRVGMLCPSLFEGRDGQYRKSDNSGVSVPALVKVQQSYTANIDNKHKANANQKPLPLPTCGAAGTGGCCEVQSRLGSSCHTTCDPDCCRCS